MYRDPIGHRIKTINNLMRKTMDKKTGQRPDRATLMHCWIIGFVRDREDSGLDTFPKDIEKEFSINRSTTSEMLKLMCKKGMIEREEVEYMVPGLRGVVEKRSFGVVDYLFERQVGEFGTLDKVVEVVDVGFLMFSVMEIHRASAYGRFQCVGGVRKLRLAVFHSCSFEVNSICKTHRRDMWFT